MFRNEKDEEQYRQVYVGDVHYQQNEGSTDRMRQGKIGMICGALILLRASLMIEVERDLGKYGYV